MRGNAQMLGEINGLVRMIVRGNAKHDVERVFGPGQFLEGHADLIAGVKFEIEPERRLTGSNGTGQILALFPAFQHRQIGIEDVGALVRPGAMDQDLAMDRRSSQDQPGQQPLAAGLNEQTGSLHTLFTHSFPLTW